MKSTCQRGEDGNCTQCGKAVEERLHRACAAKKRGPAKPRLPGIGDLTKEFFETLGITEERYKATKEMLRLDGKCGCAGRQEWMNKMGDSLGLTDVANRFAGWFREKKENVERPSHN